MHANVSSRSVDPIEPGASCRRPVVLVAAPGDAPPVSPDRTLRIVDSAAAERAVSELATGAASPPTIDRSAA